MPHGNKKKSTKRKKNKKGLIPRERQSTLTVTKNGKAYQVNPASLKSWRTTKGTKRKRSPRPGWLDHKSYYKKYNTYLKSKEWEIVRKQRIEHDRYQCQECGATDVVLQVHHINYERVFKERLSDLVTLCVDCHKQKHPDSEGIA